MRRILDYNNKLKIYEIGEKGYTITYMRLTFATISVMMAIFALVAGGFVMSSIMSSGDHADCLTAIPGNLNCAGILDPIQFLKTHINVLLDISLGVTSSLVLFLAASLMFLIWFIGPDALKLLSTNPNYARIFIDRNVRSTRKQRRWISLLEKRDPSLSCAMNT